MSQSQQTPRAPERPEIQLLLAHAKDHRPVLETGLPVSATETAPRPVPLPNRIEVPSWESKDAAPNDLAAQRWGVIAPMGPLGDSLLQAIEPLIHHREQEQGGAPVKRYRVCPDMDVHLAVQWKETVLHNEAVPKEERPWYLLILGDLHHVSIELQHVLAQRAGVGRLHVGLPNGEPDLEGYAAYVRKVLDHEQRAPGEQPPDVLLYTAQDGTEATKLGHQFLVEPSLEAMRTQWKAKWPGLEPQRIPYEASNPDQLLRVAGQARSGVMLSVTHGLGRPKQDWASPEEQRATQGALSVGPGKALTGDLLRNTAFLPGGMWFCLACFGAATPPRSAYYAWLERLAKEGVGQIQPQAVLSSLPRQGERPFMAALPQALLANEQGPLAIIGHSDLTWTLSFMEVGTTTASRASHILSALKVLANGSRAGVALASLMDAYQTVNDRLTADYQAREDAALYDTRDPTDPVQHGMLWMLRNDLRGYLLLGDPAARMAVKRMVP
jgi:hypothetical protein